jgi:DNA-directed RNA polymerase subunit RPC12/RpoP
MKNKKQIMEEWALVYKLIDEVPISDIKCPSCGKKALIVNDIFFTDSAKVEKNITCSNCNATTSLLK